MMRASLKADKGERVVRLELDTDDPRWDLSDPFASQWRKVPRIFRPESAKLILHPHEDGAGWETSSIKVSGPLVLKNGQTSSAASDSATWYRKSASPGQQLANAPEWVREIAEMVPAGVYAFAWTDKVPE